MLFVSVERERERERAVGVGTCNGAHNLCTIFFENIYAVSEYLGPFDTCF